MFEGSNAVRGRVHGATGAPRGPSRPPPAPCRSTMIAVAQRQRDANDLLTANFPKNRNRTEVETVARASRPTRYATVEPSSSRRRETRSERPPGQVE
jgi:hypothetical protein